jgi:c-di-GMP-binding flagellar brake protein YcgR
MALTRSQTVLIADSTDKEKKYKAVIHNIGDDAISLDLSSAPVEFASGTAVTVWFWDDHAIYFFDTFVEQAKQRVSALFSVRKPKKIRKSFKRGYKRIKVRITATVKDFHGMNPESATITDLSAGGARVLAREGRVKGDAFKISFVLPDGQPFDDISCDVLRVFKTETGPTDYGVEFKSFSRIRQEKLSDFIANAILTGQAEVAQ